jgi:hypothetical protein
MTGVMKTVSDRWEARVQFQPASVDDTPLGKGRPCDMYKIVNTLKLRKACGLDGFLN